MKKMIAIILAVSGMSTCFAESGHGYKVLDEISSCTPKGACRIQHVTPSNIDVSERNNKSKNRNK